MKVQLVKTIILKLSHMMVYDIDRYSLMDCKDWKSEKQSEQVTALTKNLGTMINLFVTD